MANQPFSAETLVTLADETDIPRRLTYAEFVNLDPSRDPAWRYERAKFIVAELGEDYEPELEDSPTLQAADFILHRRRLAGTKAITELRLWQRLNEYFPTLAPVIELVESPANDALRHEIEARILARQTDYEIAEMTGIPAEMVGLFEQLFFCIRDVIDKQDYITGLIGPVLRAGLDQVPVWRYYKYVAYFLGHRVLELYLHANAQTQNVDCGEEQNASPDAWNDVTIRLEMLRISTCASTDITDVTASLNAYNAMFPKEGGILRRSEKADWLGPLFKSMQDS